MHDEAGSKRILRRDMRRRLETLSGDKRHEASQILAETVLGLPELASVDRVLCCLSFGVEVDTWWLIEQLLTADLEVVVPRADFETGRLHLHPYPCDLEELSFGLRQPLARSDELEPQEIDTTVGLAIIPGLAFDPAGFRLGHGGGYFDRFLARRDLPAVGVAFDLQIVDRLPTEAHDRPMDIVVTEERTLRPGESESG